MMSSLYIGATGLKTHGEGLGVVSHNIANVSTIGYKQQSMQFDDIFYATGPSGGGWESQAGAKVALSQVGMGARPGAVRTLFAVQGALEPGSSIFDMAILGKGFFQVTNPDTGIQYYTRAGDFHLDASGVLRDPNGYLVTGIPIAAGSSAPVQGPLTGGGPIVIDPSVPCPPKATTAISLSMNLGLTGDNAQDSVNPYFSLLQSWNATATPPLNASQYGYAQPITVYDANGQKQELTLYMDRAPDPASGTAVEYVLARTPADPANAAPGEGLLMAGTLTFGSNGQITNMSAFTPTAVSQNLADWVPATLSNGLPQCSLNGQAISLDLGIQASGGWQNPPATALDVGTNPRLLPSMGQATAKADATTAYGNTSNLNGLRQNGYAKGMLMDVNITSNGVVVGIYSNSQNIELYQIPVCRFTSEDGLRHEGNNLYSASPDKTGPMTMGVPGTENYGSIAADHIEGSNVDLSREITLMIMMQRGFQMNSKTITTSDTMLQRAIELKRS
jgi:flagellar hook protein FlgE